ncbi:nuclear transport factor 2 family protein [Microbulbifer flavimaris]|uniref:Nuclear transport factor 2 family protein n=1 Tax=Microbulbifer flavimaris TaxID=1781068 RepID=A0ABX4I0F7_9GAMM|nr:MULTISPECIES: nuclear transport factor 2 family protein [Microbulbifer]KUJ83249.1 DUF4440 domain-containing protein [Microbulbifer sp. ZGT114]PCO05395.1 nuclear transport factor 2 family protein [Microbulbifer flavimaris]
MRKLLTILLFVITPLVTAADSDDRAELHSLLERFLAGAAADAAIHRRFWADDLIYTSSAGQRFGKEKIMQGLEQASGEPVTTSYSAEDVDIRLFGDTAVIAFQLVGEDTAGGQPKISRYYNTGTFVKRDGEWRAVAWQATRIPD